MCWCRAKLQAVVVGGKLHGYSLCGLLGTPYGAAPGDKPPFPLPTAPSPRSDSSGDLSPSAIPTARRGQATVDAADRSVDGRWIVV